MGRGFCVMGREGGEKEGYFDHVICSTLIAISSATVDFYTCMIYDGPVDMQI